MKNLRKKIYKQKGITLIALVITIILLLILAGVSIAMLTGENGILTQAQRAKTETENAAQNEAGILEDYNNTLNNYVNGGTVSIPEGLKVGSEVSYNPSGTYEWKDEYCDSAPQYGDLSKNLNSATGELFNIDTWKVFSINETTGEITLVPAYSTFNSLDSNGYVSFRGYQGYNNAVKLLNDACSALYGNSSKGITARSIKIEDIEGKMTDEALQRAHSYNGYEDDITLASYGNQVESEYSRANDYPSIYEQEALSSVDGGERIDSGLGMSEQTTFIEPGVAIKQATALRPTQTAWSAILDENDFETIDGINYYNLLIELDNADITYYWIASRCVDTDPEWFSFNIHYAMSYPSEGSCIASEPMAEQDTYGRGLFPIVSLNSNLISGDATSGFVVE